MTIESDLGTLIRRLNPYTNGKPGTMQLNRPAATAATNSDPEHAKAIAEAKATAEGKTAQEVTQDGEAAAKAAWQGQKATVDAEAALDLSGVEVEVDNNSYAENWTFRGQSQSIKRDIRIKYCYPSKDKDGRILCWVTEHVIVGFAGANGG